MQAHDDDKVQLLFTTHESSIMDQSLFRRDEIWFVERDSENSSNIYSLDRFKERYDKILSKSYLEVDMVLSLSFPLLNTKGRSNYATYS